ncbi:MAG: UDP-N-acetylmuramate dehydrogenase [Eubacteriales bacterium]|nr:UDP-N-acetylmuramate dehydrogenase [Eubacteriales bacterium]
MEQAIYNKLCEIAGTENVLIGEPMKKHTTFRIGGPADYFVLPHTKEELAAVISVCKRENVPWFILGNGSNLLVSDDGVRGAVIQLYKNYNDINIEGNCVRAQAGASNSVVAHRALEASLAGYEFAAGIPGTVGGAVVMNAGAYGGEMKDILLEVTVLDENGEFLVLKNEELELGYRTSIISKKGYVVVEAVFGLAAGNEDKIRGRMEELKNQRVSKQPLEYPSAGSTFKRPEGYFAGKLIMDAGLRGFSAGGAQVSEKHCGFVINKGDATAEDVINLIKEVQRIVYEKFDVHLETEVKFLGKF